MNFTRLLMSASALFMGLLGIIASFAPDEILRLLDAASSPQLPLLIQITGALYLGFAALDWMARDNLIGGIYSRPVAVANLLHFLTAGIALIRQLAVHPEIGLLWLLALPYALFATGFGVVLFRHPIRSRAEQTQS